MIKNPLLFPVSRYKVAMAQATIVLEQGQPEKAKDFAHRALEAAGKGHSGLRFHPDVGLGMEVDPDLLTRLVEVSCS